MRTFTPPAPVPNYLVQAIITTLCCCLPAGIVALVYAAQVNSKLAVGDVSGARLASKNAKVWSWVAFGAGLAVAIVYAIFIAVTVVNAK